MTRRPCSTRAWTLPEVLVVSILLGIMSIPLAYFFRGTARGTASASVKMATQQSVQVAFVMMDHDFRSMTYITDASPTSIEFRLDFDRSPGYDPHDFSRNTNMGVLEKWQDPDLDGDQYYIPNSTVPAWSVGDNLSDEDDNHNYKIDVQCRYVLEGKSLVRYLNFDETGWGSKTVVAKGVVSLTFSYFAFRNTFGNSSLATNSEGLVTGQTVDQSPRGNQNGMAWDTQAERDRIDMVRIDLGCNPALASDTMRMDVPPTFLIVRRGRM